MLFGNQKIFFLIKLRGMPRINDVGRDLVERDNQVGGTNLVGRPTRQEQGHIKSPKFMAYVFSFYLAPDFIGCFTSIYATQVPVLFCLQNKTPRTFLSEASDCDLHKTYTKSLANIGWKGNVFFGDTNRWAIIFFQENILKYEWNDNVPHKSLST